jgi:hypothetical protein
MPKTPPPKANPKPNAKRPSRKKPETRPTDSIPVPTEDLKTLKAFHREYVEASNETKSRYDAMLRQIATVREEAEIPDHLVLNPKTWAFEKQEDQRQAENEAADATDAADPDPDDAAPTDKKPEVGKPDDAADGPPE